MAKQTKNQAKEVQVVDVTFQNEGESVESRVEYEIQKFNVADARIQELKEQFKDLKIEGIEDKKGIKAVSEAISIVRSLRTSVEAKRKDLKNFYLNTGKGIDAEAKRITELLLEVENPLKDKKQAIDDEIQRIKDEEERVEQERINKRVEALKTAGIQFDGSFYSIGSNISVDLITIKDLKDEDFEKLIQKVSEENEKIQAKKRIEELNENRKEQLLPFWSFITEEQRSWGFGEISEERFQEILKDVQKAKSDFEAVAKKQKEDAEKLEREKRQLNFERNSFKLEKIGFEKESSGIMIFKTNVGSHIVHKHELEVDTESFTEVFDIAESKVLELKEKSEKAKKEAEEKAKENAKNELIQSRFRILSKLEGTEFSNDNYWFEYGDCKMKFNELVEMTEEEFAQQLFVIRERISDWSKRLAKEQEEKRLAKLPDLEKVEIYCEEIMFVAVPQLADTDAQEELAELRNQMKSAIERTLQNIKKLK